MKKITLVFSFLFLLTACSAPVTLPTPTSTLDIATPFNTDLPPSETPTAPAIETQSAPTAVKFDADTLARMTPDQKLASAPEGKDGYVRSGMSTVIDSIVIYRDGSGAAVQTYDLTTGEMLPITESKIVEFDLTDGSGKYEMRRFVSQKDAQAFISSDENTKWFEGSDYEIIDSWLDLDKDKALEFVSKVKKIPNWKPENTIAITVDGKGKYVLGKDSVKGGVLLEYMDIHGNFVPIFVPVIPGGYGPAGQSTSTPNP